MTYKQIMNCSVNLTSEMLTRPSRKEQSLAFWVHMWRYLHQWHGNEPFTQERQLKQKREERVKELAGLAGTRV